MTREHALFIMPITFQVKLLGCVFMLLSQARHMISGVPSSSAAAHGGGTAAAVRRGVGKFTGLSARGCKVRTCPPRQLPAPCSPMGMLMLHHTQAQCLP